MVVTFYRTTESGQSVMGRAELVDGGVVFTGLSARFVASLQDHGIAVGGKRLTPADGEAFLRGLPFAYNGAYVRAALEE